jgi:hypothetical protein
MITRGKCSFTTPRVLSSRGSGSKVSSGAFFKVEAHDEDKKVGEGTHRGQKMSLISAGFPAFRPRGPNTVHATFSENLRLKLLAARIIWKGGRQ